MRYLIPTSSSSFALELLDDLLYDFFTSKQPVHDQVAIPEDTFLDSEIEFSPVAQIPSHVLAQILYEDFRIIFPRKETVFPRNLAEVSNFQRSIEQHYEIDDIAQCASASSEGFFQDEERSGTNFISRFRMTNGFAIRKREMKLVPDLSSSWKNPSEEAEAHCAMSSIS